MFEPFQQPCRDEVSLSHRLQGYLLLKYASQCWPAHFLAAPDLKGPVHSHPKMVGLAMNFLCTYKPLSANREAAKRPAIADTRELHLLGPGPLVVKQRRH